MSLKSTIKPLSLAVLTLSLSNCATAPASPPPAPPETPKIADDATQTHEQIAKLQDKIQDLETRLSAMNEKINVQNGMPTNPATSNSEIPTQSVQKPLADTKIIPHAKVTTRGKVSEKPIDDATPNEAVDRYREAKILFDSKRYSDAILEFSDFIKNEPDHVLAPAAQYYIGQGYFKQKEYKLAEEELSRGLVSYPHSNYVPDYLLGLSETSEALGKTDKVLYFRQKLLSSFPNSPQAKGVNLNKPAAKKAEPEALQPPVEHAPAEKLPAEKTIETPEAPKPPTAPDAEPRVIGGGT